jgi:predicted nucleic acid-binding protein
LDTTVVSAWVKTRPNRGVIAWLDAADEDRVFMSVVTLAELRYGIERMAPGRRQKRLDEWARSELLLRFEGRVLSIEGIDADNWGKGGGAQRSGGAANRSHGCIYRCHR